MYRNDRLTAEVVRRIRRIEKRVLDSYEATAIEHEPQITDRLLGKIEEAFDGQAFSGVVWEAKTLTSQGPNSQEARFGADFMGVLRLKLPGYSVAKGFMAQAKRIEPGQKYKKKEFDELVGQCDKMLNVSPTSYVFIYSSQSGIRIASAIDVASATQCNPLDLATISISDFFKRHFECQIGDRRFSAANASQLEVLQQEYGARSISYIFGESLDMNRFA